MVILGTDRHFMDRMAKSDLASVKGDPGAQDLDDEASKTISINLRSLSDNANQLEPTQHNG